MEPVFEALINSSLPGQNVRNFADDIFKWIFLNENIWISIKISLKLFPINNIPALVQIMARRCPGDKPFSEPILTQFTDAYMRHWRGVGGGGGGGGGGGWGWGGGGGGGGVGGVGGWGGGGGVNNAGAVVNESMICVYAITTMRYTIYIRHVILGLALIPEIMSDAASISMQQCHHITTVKPTTTWWGLWYFTFRLLNAQWRI